MGVVAVCGWRGSGKWYEGCVTYIVRDVGDDRQILLDDDRDLDDDRADVVFC